MRLEPLFDDQGHNLPATPPAEAKSKVTRQKQIDAAFEHADARFREEYERLVLRFVSQGRSFTGEDVSDAYRERPYLPQPRNWRATGGIFQKLIHRGVLIAVDYRKRKNGNMTAVYKGVG